MVRVLLVAMLLLPASALAQTSQKTIRIIVPFAPGASADGIARAISIARRVLPAPPGPVSVTRRTA